MVILTPMNVDGADDGTVCLGIRTDESATILDFKKSDNLSRAFVVLLLHFFFRSCAETLQGYRVAIGADEIVLGFAVNNRFPSLHFCILRWLGCLKGII